MIKQDRDDTRAFYGRMVPFRTLLTGLHAAPAEAQPLLTALNRYAPITPQKPVTPAAKKSN